MINLEKLNRKSASKPDLPLPNAIIPPLFQFFRFPPLSDGNQNLLPTPFKSFRPRTMLWDKTCDL